MRLKYKMGFEDSDGVTHRFNYCRPATTRNFCCTSDRGFSSISAPARPGGESVSSLLLSLEFFFPFFFSAASADFSAFFTRATKRRKNPIPFCGGRISGRSRYRFAAQQTLLLLSTSLDEKIFDFSSLFFPSLFPPIRFPNGGKILKILNDLSSRLAIEKTDRV